MIECNQYSDLIVSSIRRNDMEHILETGCLEQFESILRTNERSRATIEKYMRDLRGLLQYLGGEAQTADGRGQVLTKELVVAYKQQLQAKYSPASVNSMLAAINCFCRLQRPDGISACICCCRRSAVRASASASFPLSRWRGCTPEKR